MSARIYIADDEKDIRQLVSTFFRNGGFDVECFEDGASLYKKMETDMPDLIILDIMMPGIDGLSLCRKIRERSDIPIIFVSARGTEFDRINGLTIGADDYLVKPFSPTELVIRAKALLRRAEKFREAVPVKEVLNFGNIEIDLQQRKVSIGAKEFPSTPTEFDFLCHMIRNSERAVSRKELLKELWQFDFDCDTRASDDLVKRLRKKLKEHESNVMIENVWGFGFKLTVAEENAY